MEREVLQAELGPWLRSGEWTLQVCGFGVAAAAACSSAILARHRPRHVVLTGIAGVYRARSMVGRAVWFDRVLCDGIGVGTGDSFTSAAELGWPHAHDSEGRAIGDVLPLQLPAADWTKGRRAESESSRPADTLTAEAAFSGHLVTVCAASADERAAEARFRRVTGGLATAAGGAIGGAAPDLPPPADLSGSEASSTTPTTPVIAEDMEGFGVALACRLHCIPLATVRGLSNVAGDRRHAGWEVERALRAAAAQIARLPPDL